MLYPKSSIAVGLRMTTATERNEILSVAVLLVVINMVNRENHFLLQSPTDLTSVVVTFPDTSLQPSRPRRRIGEISNATPPKMTVHTTVILGSFDVRFHVALNHLPSDRRVLPLFLCLPTSRLPDLREIRERHHLAAINRVFPLVGYCFTEFLAVLRVREPPQGYRTTSISHLLRANLAAITSADTQPILLGKMLPLVVVAVYESSIRGDLSSTATFTQLHKTYFTSQELPEQANSCATVVVSPVSFS